MRLLLKLLCAFVGCLIGLIAVAIIMEGVLQVKYNPMFGAPVGLLLGAIGWKLPGKKSKISPP